jgi:hypothetical protein
VHRRETDFAKAVAKLKPPSAASYSQADWDAAYTASTQATSDTRLYKAAQWLALETSAALTAFANPVLATLSPKWSTILAVAAHNREYRTSVELAVDESKRAREAGLIAADALAALRIENVAGQRFKAADFAQTGVDLTENWLFDASITASTGEPTGDLAPAAVTATQAYSFRKAISTIWNDAWWAGWYFEIDASGTTRWMPDDRKLESLILAWATRQEANLMNYPNIDRTVWPKLKAARRRELARVWGVVGLVETKRNVRFNVAPLTYLSRHMPAYKYEKGALEGCYLGDFVETDMPRQPGMTVSRLLLAWHIIYDIAKLLTKASAPPNVVEC